MNATEQIDLEVQSLLLASGQHDLATMRNLLKGGSANVQDTETGYTPLHAAIAACEVSAPSSPVINGTSDSARLTNGHVEQANDTSARAKDLELAAKAVRLLLQNGAIWNDLDKNNETPGCIARRLGLDELYELMVDAGCRAEMLLNRLDEYEALADESDNEDEQIDAEEAKERNQGIAEDDAAVINGETPALENVSASQQEDPSSEVLLNQITPLISTATNPQVTNNTYLRSDLAYQQGRLLDADSNGVMMAWETDIMEQTANLLVPATLPSRPRVLNIGFGMGIIDDFFQEKSPEYHDIVEAHPDVLKRMRDTGWYEKPSVTVHEGKWQDVLPKIIESGRLFDAIYFDTFAEDYKAFRNFFSDFVIGLLDDGGRWGFFNGLGADRQICYDVYTKVVEMDLLEAGYDVEWTKIPIANLDENEEWQGVRRRYWALDEYRLPVCTFVG